MYKRGNDPKLKNCPFCGGEAEVVPHKFFSEALKDWKVDSYGVECKNCHTSGYQFWGTEEHAIRAWNRRVGDDLMERMEDDGR